MPEIVPEEKPAASTSRDEAMKQIPSTSDESAPTESNSARKQTPAALFGGIREYKADVRSKHYQDNPGARPTQEQQAVADYARRYAEIGKDEAKNAARLRKLLGRDK